MQREPAQRGRTCGFLIRFDDCCRALRILRLTDPFNSRLGGGTAINYLGGVAGPYLGTELDLGVQMRWKPIALLSLTGTLEAGLLVPGNAFTLRSGAVMGPEAMARLRLSASL